MAGQQGDLPEEVSGVKAMSHIYSCTMYKPIFHCKKKPFTLGPCIGLDPQRHNFTLWVPTCWYPKTLKFVLPPTQILKFALPPRRNPKASQWGYGPVVRSQLKVVNIHKDCVNVDP